MITKIELLDTEFHNEFQQKLGSDYSFSNFLISVLSLRIIFDKVYRFSIEFTNLEEDAIFIDKIFIYIFKIGLWNSFPDPITSNKFTFSMIPANRHLTRDEWYSEEYRSVLLRQNIKDFNIAIQSDNKLLPYCKLLLTNLLNSFPDKVIPEILSILFSAIDNLLHDTELIIVTVGEFEEVDLTDELDPEAKQVFGLNTEVERCFSLLFEEGTLFDSQKSSLEYKDKKVIVKLVPKALGVTIDG